MFKKNFLLLFVSAVIIIPVTAYAIVNWLEKKYKPLPVYEQMEGVQFSFKNQRGQIKNQQILEGKIAVVDFFFTQCPTICPALTRSMARVQQAFTGNREFELLSFSVDPERDSSERLALYVQQFNVNEENWNLFTGDKIDIYRLARKSFQVVATDGDGGANDFIHSDKLVLLDKKQRVRGYYDGTNSNEVDQLIKDTKRLLEEN